MMRNEWLARVAVALVTAGCVAGNDGEPDIEVVVSAADDNCPPSCGGGGGSTECATVCDTTTECDTRCLIPNGDGTSTSRTCGEYGVCVSCAAACTASSPCEGIPWCKSDSGVVTTCRGAQKTCVNCNYNNCRAWPGNLCAQTCDQPYLESWWTSDGSVRSIAKGYYACTDWGTTRWNDSDLDQIPDSLELALAQRFFPNLNMRDIPPDINSLENFSSYQTFYGSRGQYHVGSAPGTFLPFVVRPYKGTTSCTGDFECLEIVYALLYNYDYGDAAPWSLWDRLNDDHVGDNEMYSVLVYRPGATPWSTARTSASYWYVFREFLAAHFCANTDSSQVTTRAGGATTRQNVWVAEFKDASYPTQTNCNQGACYHDACDTYRRFLTPGERDAATSKLRNAGDWMCSSSPRITQLIAAPNATVSNPARLPTSVNYRVWSGDRFGESGTSLRDIMRAGTINWFEKLYDAYGNVVQDGTWTCW